MQHHLVIDDLLHVVVRPIAAVLLLAHVHEVEAAKAESVRQLAVLGIAGGTRAGLEVLGDVGLFLKPRGQAAGPVEVLADALGVGGQHLVRGIVHVAAQLLEVLGEALDVLGPQHHAGGELGVAATELGRRLLEQQAGGTFALERHGRSGGDTGKASADHNDVVLLVPGDLVHGGGSIVALGKGASRQLGGHTHSGDAAKREAGGLEEVATRLAERVHEGNSFSVRGAIICAAPCQRTSCTLPRPDVRAIRQNALNAPDKLQYILYVDAHELG